MRKENLVSEFLWCPQTISSGGRRCEEQRGNIEAGEGGGWEGCQTAPRTC